VGEQDWLDTGHGGGEGLRPMIKGSSRDVPDRAPIRSVLRGADSARSPKRRKRNKALVGWLLYCATAVGGTAAAFTVRDTLFPQLDGPTRKAVWVSSNVDPTSTAAHGSSTSEGASTTAKDVTTTIVATTVGAPALALEAQTVPTVSNQGPSNSVNNRGPAGGAVPATGTTVAATDPPQGPGPGTTIADDKGRGGDTSTASSPSSAPPASADVTSASAPPTSSDGTSPGHGKGKGGGGG
jgi:cytoskeletal protein RodZ